MDEYAYKFIELSVYALELVATEQQWIDCFIYGLSTEIHNNLIEQTHVFLIDVIDKAYRIDEWSMEVRAAESDLNKRLRINTLQSSQKDDYMQQ